MRAWRPGKGGLPPPSAARGPHSPPREYLENDEAHRGSFAQGVRP